MIGSYITPKNFGRILFVNKSAIFVYNPANMISETPQVVNEGVMKLWQKYRYAKLGDKYRHIEDLMRWRTILYYLGLIGQYPSDRFNGVGYGNVSQLYLPEGYHDRPNRQQPYIITQTQTGLIETLTPHHYSLVLRTDPKHNYARTIGQNKASSELMTHGSIYELNQIYNIAPPISYVFHIHSYQLWKWAIERGFIPQTAPGIEYGTPEMAADISRVASQTDFLTRRLLVMLGHEDGLISAGATADEAGLILLSALHQSGIINHLPPKVLK